MCHSTYVNREVIQYKTQNEEITHHFILAFRSTDQSILVCFHSRRYCFLAPSLVLVRLSSVNLDKSPSSRAFGIEPSAALRAGLFDASR